MNQKAVSIYYALSIAVLATALFAIQPRDNPEVTLWQQDVYNKFSVAWQQLHGDTSYLDEVASLYEGVASFYNQSAVAFTDLVKDDGSDEAVGLVYIRVYQTLASAIGDRLEPQVAGEFDVQPRYENFMTEDPIYDIVPSVSGIVFSPERPSTTPVNPGNPWFTALDASTGQEYCMAIFNGEVNKYLGACVYDYH